MRRVGGKVCPGGCFEILQSVEMFFLSIATLSLFFASGWVVVMVTLKIKKEIRCQRKQKHQRENSRFIK